MVELSKYSAGSVAFPTSSHHSQMMALIFPPSSPLTYSVVPISFLVASRSRRNVAPTEHHQDARRSAAKVGPPESRQSLMTPRMSSASTTRWSSPSTLISVPEYLRYTTTSPTLTLTSSWAPAAMTSAFWCSPLAVSGSTIPEGVASSGSTGLSSTRAPSGLNLTLQPPLYSLLDAHKVKPSLVIRQWEARFTFS